MAGKRTILGWRIHPVVRGTNVDDHLARQLLDIEAIKQLKARYLRFMDDKDWDAFGSCLSDDFEITFLRPVLDRYPPEYLARLTPEGHLPLDRDQLLAWLRVVGMQCPTLHYGHMPEITILGPESAVGLWRMTDMTCWPGDPPVWMRGHGSWEEEYVRTHDGWRIRRSRFQRYEIDVSDATAKTWDGARVR